jgi:hypothetical protein
LPVSEGFFCEIQLVTIPDMQALADFENTGTVKPKSAFVLKA